MKIKSISIILIIMFFSFMGTKEAYAFWNKTIHTSEITITIGEWQIFPTWEPDESYSEGDVVFWEGQYYIRTSQGGNSNIQPDSPAGWNFWTIED